MAAAQYPDHAQEATVLPEDTADQLAAIHDALITSRTGLELITQDEHGPTAYMQARNARIQINEALRRINYLLGKPDDYPDPPE